MFKERYERYRERLLNDNSINDNNRKVIRDFLEHEEYKLKRKEGLSEVDEKSYKTLYSYLGKIKLINEWFKNKAWAELSEEEIKKVIDDLEDGIIKNKNGDRHSDRAWFYQIMKGELFNSVGKAEIVSRITRKFGIKGRLDNKQVSFVKEEDFRKLIDCAITPEQKCLFFLAFDIGENLGSLLELEANDCKRQINRDTQEPEYLIILSKDKLKRSRTARSEITNYQETVEFLDTVLRNMKPTGKIISNRFMKNKNLSEIHKDSKLFKFGIKTAQRFFNRAVKISGVRCLPDGQSVKWKDLRSSMACDLLAKGWSRDEVNARLGHKPSSREIDRYINYLSLDRNKPKQKVYDSNIRQIQEDLDRQKELNKLQGSRLLEEKQRVDEMKELFKTYAEKTSGIINDLRKDNLHTKQVLLSLKKLIN